VADTYDTRRGKGGWLVAGINKLAVAVWLRCQCCQCLKQDRPLRVTGYRITGMHAEGRASGGSFSTMESITQEARRRVRQLVTFQ
jgi:hypothetical protein